MKKYLLLRNNVQSGPYSLEDLKSLSPVKSDLIWIEGESCQWNFAPEISELKAFITEPLNNPVRPARRRKVSELKLLEILPVAPETNREAISTTPEDIFPATKNSSFSDLKERPAFSAAEQKFQFRNRQRNNGMWIMALFCMLITSAFIIKKIVENNNELTEIKPVAAAVPLVGLPEGKVEEKSADIVYKNAIQMDVENPDSVKNKIIRKVSLTEIRKKVTVKTNKYKVRMFGGVDDLQLNVRNDSKLTLDKVNIKVTYLKPNGDEVRSESYSVYSVSPGETKILVVPPSRRGVKVKSVITGIESKQPIVSQI